MARQSSPQVADSYYTVIRGKKYDRRMLELAEGLTSGRGDGRISINDAKNLLRVVKDSNNYSPTEKQTMEYIRKHFKFTKEGDEFFRGEIRKWAASKNKKKAAPKAKKPAATTSTEATAAIPAPEVVRQPAMTEAPVTAGAKKGSSPLLQILLALVAIAAIAAIFYFFAYKSSCARPTPAVTNAPAPEVKPVPVPPIAEAKPAPVNPAPAVAPGAQPPATPVDAELKALVEKTSMRFIAEKTALTPAAEKGLDELAAKIKDKSIRLKVIGHTCSLGPKELNQKISEKRAQVIKDALIARGLPAGQIQTEGVADSQPAGDNRTVAGRVASRRVTFKVLN